jgi:hypothetical protein
VTRLKTDKHGTAAAEPMATDYKATTLCRQSVSGHVWLRTTH